MNINSDKQNQWPLSHQSPYLSPLIGFDDDHDLHSQEIPDFNLEIYSEQMQEQCGRTENEGNPNLFGLLESSSSRNKVEESMNQISQDVKKNPALIGKSISTVEKGSSNLGHLIHFLIQNDSLSELDLKARGNSLVKAQPNLKFVLDVMTLKFKKLKKTKQQMTKFCMRKAFKFINDTHISEKKGRKSSKDETDSAPSFQMPFKKNSSDKTMNTNFLKQVFRKSAFVLGYKNFLKSFRSIIDEDNEYKIKYLAETIQSYISTDNIKKIEEIKRLPWTKTILMRTQKLAISLMKFAEQEEEDIQEWI